MSWAGIGAGVASAVVGSALNKRGKKNQQSALPELIQTGNSTYNTKTGVASLDPSIRQGQDRYMNSITGVDGVGGFKNDVTSMFDTFDSGMKGVRDEFSTLRGEFEGNQSAFRKASLAPLRENIASASGKLDRELGRTGVRGSFANQAKAGFDFDAGESLTNKEAEIENTRINRLGDFLGIDADLLKTGLTSEQGRAEMMLGLEESLKGISTERFNQEMKVLGLPAQMLQGTAANANASNAREGMFAQTMTNAFGDIIGGIGDSFGGSAGNPVNPVPFVDANGLGVG